MSIRHILFGHFFLFNLYTLPLLGRSSRSTTRPLVPFPTLVLGSRYHSGVVLLRRRRRLGPQDASTPFTLPTMFSLANIHLWHRITNKDSHT